MSLFSFRVFQRKVPTENSTANVKTERAGILCVDEKKQTTGRDSASSTGIRSLDAKKKVILPHQQKITKKLHKTNKNQINI